ncbi:MAG: hypothetical protein NC086_09280 [Alistipes sp.]|nr:hypothetical protein [Alistipes sp.]
MYYLMNKDVIVASFYKENGRWKLSQPNSQLPLGKFEINDWLEDRKAYKHNHHLKQLMIDCGCETAEGFIKITHAASINDSFWIRNEEENVTWNDISFYRNDFNDTISKLAFEGLGLYGMQMSSTSPELTTDGSFRKCWKKENEEIYLYKRGISGAYNAGLEPYCEALASEIIYKADKTSVQYSVLKLHGETATKCKVFTNEEVGFVPLRKLVERNISLDELLHFFDELECREQFQRILVLDAVTFNVDRHLGNMGVLVDNDTQEILGISPNFDFNLSMLPYVTKEEFEHIGTKLLDYGPAIGDDFTRVGQKMLTAEIRKELINLQGFCFSFRGNKDFEPSRVRIMEEMVDRQIRAILKGEILYTKDVFVPKETKQKVGDFDNTVELKKASTLAARLKKADIFSSVMEEIKEDSHVCVIATIHENEEFVDFIVYLENMEISCERNGVKVSADEMRSEFQSFVCAYDRFCRIVEDLLINDDRLF